MRRIIHLVLFGYLTTAFPLKPFPPINSLWQKSSSLLPFWTPLDYIHNINSPKPVILDGEPFVAYKNMNNTLILLFDNCPHQGAKLSKGKLVGNDLTCAYHGFKFKNGKFVGLPMSGRLLNSSICVPRIPTLVKNDMVYFLPFTDLHSNDALEIKLVPEPYVCPEKNDKSFTMVNDKIIINKNCDIVTSNILDMLHISFVHAFGNRNAPLPYKLKYEQMSNTSGKTTFTYTSGDKSMSKNVAFSDEVIVENEFYLPSTTVTRVIADKMVKTVITRALPVNENKTILFWEVHRNFFNENYIIERLGNILMHYLMEQTLNEDVEILKHVNEKYFKGSISTKYDITIRNFLKAKEKAKKKK
jgi:phenylpropionate dioxygenase-like ring-hydroxylating dioxygenase large terminal subunit